MSKPAARLKPVPEAIDNWETYFVEIANAVARKSKDPRCQVGCVLTSADHLIVSTGFNGLARGVFDSETLLSDVDEKLVWICHAEANAILNAARLGVSLKGCTIYVNKFPCFNCCQLIVQSGISAIHTPDHKYWDDDPVDKGHTRKRSLLSQAGIRIAAPNHPDYGGNGTRQTMLPNLTTAARRGPIRAK